MSIAIVDARGWQNEFDLKTGEQIRTYGPVSEMVKGVLSRHPYPGDLDMESNRWVSDTALDLINSYNPRFVFLTYAAQYFTGRYRHMAREERTKLMVDAFWEVERFITRSGFAAIVVGTGDMTPLLGFIDTTTLDGLAVCTHWTAGYAGLYGPSPADMKTLSEHPHVERIFPREEVVALFGGTSEQAVRVPEYLMVARQGYAFKTISGAMKVPVMIPSPNEHIPLHAPGRIAGAITGIRTALEQELAERPAALIIMEGVGLSDFVLPCLACRNGTEWYCYEPGEAQHLTIASGAHRFLDYPTGYKYFDEIEATTGYPFSGYFKSIPQGTFASTFPGKSIAVGNRSMFMHMVTGTDLSVECFARNLYNQGTMAVIHREDKP